MPLPKVLIVGQSFNNDTGGGITLTNLFSGWPKDKLAVACSGYLLLDNIDTEICDTYYQLGYKEKKWKFPFNLFKRKYPSGLAKLEGKRIQNLTIPNSKFRVKFLTEYINPFLDYLGFTHFIYRTGLSKEFKAWLDEYNPDVVYAQTSSLDGILFCTLVQSYLNKPYAFHMMDDWPSTIAENGLFHTYWQKVIDKRFRMLLSKTDLLLTISDEMTREYKRRYNKDSCAFHNPIDMEFWKQYQRKDYELGSPITILYAGRTGLGIQDSLITIATGISQVNRKLQLDIRFILQTAEYPEWARDFDCVEHRRFVPYEELPKRFSEADFLILPYDFSAHAIKFIRYSMPTKASEYMMSGTPVIVFAPEVTALAKYAKEHGWATVVTTNNVDVLISVLSNLVSHKEEREQIAHKAISLAELRHDSEIVTKEFRNVICSLVQVKAPSKIKNV